MGRWIEEVDEGEEESPPPHPRMKITAAKGWHSPLCQASPPKLGSSALPLTHPLPLPAQPGSHWRIRFQDTQHLGGWGGEAAGRGGQCGGVPGPSRPRASEAGRAGVNLASLSTSRAVHGALAGCGSLGFPIGGARGAPQRPFGHPTMCLSPLGLRAAEG